MTEKDYYKERRDVARSYDTHNTYRQEWTIMYEIHELTDAVNNLNETLTKGFFQITECLKWLRYEDR